MIDLAHAIAIRQLSETDDDLRLVIMHPGYAAQHRVLEYYLGEPAAVYVRFDGIELNSQNLFDQTDSALLSQSESETLSGVETLILDECDRAEPAAFNEYLEAMLPNLAVGKMIIFTRSVPKFVYQNAGLRAQTRFVPSEPALMLVDYAQLNREKVFLEVCSLGSGRVILNGHVVDNWDGTLPRALFFYLIDRGMTTRSEIFDTFWPNLNSREATNVFHVTKRKISEVLGVDLTLYWSGFYRISSDIQLSYDTALFSEMITDSAVAPSEKAIRFLTNAISLYQGNFLTSMDMGWVRNRRDELLITYGEALASLAKALEIRGQEPEALGLYVRASVTNPQREDIARSIMNLYADMQMIDDAIVTYQRLEDELDRNLGVPPSKETQELILKIRSRYERS
ncbi:MAG: bacterial transcriptional activator domain-containing protein [Chloroflexota bacterium]